MYVLDPKLQDGHKLPKWQPRSRHAQYLGNSPLHASTVGLVRNLVTDNISPQFHLVFNNFFETVHSGDAEPPEWQELLIFNSFRAGDDEEDTAPSLSEEWLSPEELAARANNDFCGPPTAPLHPVQEPREERGMPN